MKYIKVLQVGKSSLYIHEYDNPRGYSFMSEAPNGLTDTPIMYDNGQVVYDHPERLPKYVRERFAKKIRRINKLNN